MNRGSKLIALVLILVVVASGLGYWLLAPKMLGQLVTYTTQQTSIVTSSEESVTTLASSTTLASGTTLWINVTATKPVSYYLSQLKSTQTQPYVQLAWELQALPDATNATAVAKITYLALNATNPEAKEAFELMMKGGTPSPSDFTYTVPKYNTELQVLYWLACQNEFKKDDTLALSIAMVHGLWVSMGDEQVKQAVNNDSTQLLRYLRETSELQRLRGYYQLEDYPLEAKLCLAWTGGMTPAFGEYGLSNHRMSRGYTSKRVDLKAYTWNTVNVTTLKSMRQMAEEKHWLTKDVNQLVGNLEYYFYFQNKRGYEDTWRTDHWIYSSEGVHDVQIEIAGEKHKSWHLLTPNYQFDFYVRNGYVTGNCVDETVFVGAWAKSWGIATTPIWTICAEAGHVYSAYYDPQDGNWKAYADQLAWYIAESKYLGANLTFIVFHIFKPPFQQGGYVRIFAIQTNWFGGNMYVSFYSGVSPDSIRETFSKGVPTSQMKQWLLYS